MTSKMLEKQNAALTTSLRQQKRDAGELRTQARRDHPQLLLPARRAAAPHRRSARAQNAETQRSLEEV